MALCPGLRDFVLVTRGQAAATPVPSSGWGSGMQVQAMGGRRLQGGGDMPSAGGRGERETPAPFSKGFGEDGSFASTPIPHPEHGLRAQKPHVCHFTRHCGSSGDFTDPVKSPDLTPFLRFGLKVMVTKPQ